MESVVAENAVPDVVAKADANAAPPSDEGSAPSAPKAGTSEDTSSWTEKAQKRYDELTRKTYDSLSRAERAEYRAQLAEHKLAELETQQKAKTEPVAPDNFPTLEQYGYDEGKYQAAVATHVTKIATEQGKTAAQAALNEERQRQQEENVGKSWATKEAEFSKSKPDYADKVKRDPRDGGPVISKPMADLIMGSQLGPQVAYYLAENAEKSAAIANLPPIEQAREIGRIEAKLELAKLPPAPVVSQAPPPVSKVDSDDAPAEKSPNDMTDTEYAKWRKKQIAARRNS